MIACYYCPFADKQLNAIRFVKNSIKNRYRFCNEKCRSFQCLKAFRSQFACNISLLSIIVTSIVFFSVSVIIEIRDKSDKCLPKICVRLLMIC